MGMINKLHHAMIKLYASDAKRIQHFCKVHSYAKLIGESEGLDERTQFILEADFLVNFYEDDVSHEAVEHAYNNIFKTETGRLICREMYGM
jgi:hypothetical protein